MLNLYKYLLLLQALQLVNPRMIEAYFEGFKCDSYDKEYIATMKCWMEMDDKGGQTFMNAVFVMGKDVNSLMDHFRFLVAIGNKSNRTYVSVMLNICEALSSSFGNPVSRMISEEIHRVSNLPYECSFKKGVQYAVNNFSINLKLIPPFTPALKWFANSIFYVGKRRILTYDAFGRVERKKTNLKAKKNK